MFEDVDDMTLEIEHWDDLKAQQGYETVWSCSHKALCPLEQQIFSNKSVWPPSTVISELGETFEDTKYETFTCMAKDGTVGGLWAAAESCYKQARIALGDWHYFVEDFEVSEDGTLELVTGLPKKKVDK